VHADLVRASGVQMGPQQIHRVEAGQPHEIRPRPSVWTWPYACGLAGRDDETST
jgi:hypothetical protein